MLSYRSHSPPPGTVQCESERGQVTKPNPNTHMKTLVTVKPVGYDGIGWDEMEWKRVEMYCFLQFYTEAKEQGLCFYTRLA